MHSTSKAIILLLAARPLLNNIPSDFVLGSLLGYNISVLTLWSISFLLFCLVRLARPPRSSPLIFVLVGAFLLYIVLFGLMRLFTPSALITDFLYILQFFVAVLIAPSVTEDVEFGYILKFMFFGSITLILIHASAPLWFAGTLFDPQTGGYLGLFETKHLAAMTFFSLVPYAFLYYRGNRSKLSLAVLCFLITSLILSFQRTALLSLSVMIFVVLYFSRSLRIALPIFAAMLLATQLLPSEHFLKFFDEKLMSEYDAYLKGHSDVIGGGRLGVFFFATNWYLSQFSLVEQLIGLGTAQSYRLYLNLWGHFTYAHIQMLQLFIDYGFIGFVMVCAILFYVFQYRRSQLRLNHSWANMVAMSVFLAIAVELLYGMPLTSGGTSSLNAFWFLMRDRSAKPSKIRALPETPQVDLCRRTTAH